ncbi:MAG: TetR/AcrR family transcriptional regulator [Nitrospirae bacterium]|nr:TetR/AcrR family transcriptional regulator [Nitrospirota bacterium]
MSEPKRPGGSPPSGGGEGALEPGGSRERILGAAAEVFADVGLEGSRIDVIARKADVNKAMIYYHFGSKEGLYLAVLESLVTRIATETESALSKITEPISVALEIFDRNFELYKTSEQIMRIILRESANGGEYFEEIRRRHPEIFKFQIKRMIDILQQAMDSGLLNKVDAEKVVACALGLMVIFFGARPLLGLILAEEPSEGTWNAWKDFFKEILVRVLSKEGPTPTA